VKNSDKIDTITNQKEKIGRRYFIFHLAAIYTWYQVIGNPLDIVDPHSTKKPPFGGLQ